MSNYEREKKGSRQEVGEEMTRPHVAVRIRMNHGRPVCMQGVRGLEVGVNGGGVPPRRAGAV